MYFNRPQIEKFHLLWWSLLDFVNEMTNMVSPSVFKNMVLNRDNKTEHELRLVLWNNPDLLDDYISENPSNFSPIDIETVAGWRNYRFGDFTLCKVVRGVGIFSAHAEPRHFYSVYPLRSPFEELVPDIPIFVRTALIPYQGSIVYDGTIASYPIRFAGGMRREISNWYIDASERGLIKTTIPELPLSPTEQTAKQIKTNKSVMRYFKAFLRKKSLSDKIINRDVDTVDSLADFMVRNIDETLTLRDISRDVFRKFMTSFPDDVPRPTIVGLKRFFTYLMESDRIDWDLVQDILQELRSL